ncbi:hypothetical protein [Aquimarina sp. Aq107]|uniref:hypothetical protein n=1 Tax=Aquimarina sp. Aq107 TaxID=1191912 RepID=UPI000D5528DB|nr:hypothetical protein [Aquimarina sp. Aq107]
MSNNINKILSFFGLKKPLQITEEELVHINSDTLTDEKRIVEIIDLDSINTDISQIEELLFDIYEEAKMISNYEDNDLYKIGFNSLEHYKKLITSHPEIKKQFFYFITPEISQKDRSKRIRFIETKSEIPENFKRALGQLVLNSKMRLNNTDFTHFFQLWKNTYPYYYPLRPLLRQLQKYSTDHKISPELNTCLHSFLRSKSIQYLPIKEYMEAKSTIHRIILENSKISLVPSAYVFQLLPDSFGTHVNKLLSGMNEKYQHNFSKILKILCHTIDQNTLQQINTYIDNTDENKFDVFLYNIIRKSSYLKLRSVTLRNKVYNSKDDIYGTYEQVYIENIDIIKGLVSLAGIRKHQKCVKFITTILERCFGVTLGTNYGTTSRSLGIICIQTLANKFDIEGKNELRKLYQKTSFKLIKKQIEKESKILEETNGESLL